MKRPSSSWLALQIAEQLRALDAVSAGAVKIVQGLDPDTVLELEPRLASDDVDELQVLCELLAELAGQVCQLAQRLPEGDIDVDGDELASSAAGDLEDGIIDPIRVRLAARMLPVGTGWLALATALRSCDTHTTWEDLSVGELLGSFRDATDVGVISILAAADLPARLEFASCDEHDLLRLASVLEQHARAA
jgi:hypothetical protein